MDSRCLGLDKDFCWEIGDGEGRYFAPGVAQGAE